MGLELNRVHHYVKEPGGNSVKLIKTNPYMRFSRDGEGTVFLQSGRFYYEGGEELTEVTAWLADELRKANPKVLRECGYEPSGSRSVQGMDTSGNQPARRSPIRRS